MRTGTGVADIVPAAGRSVWGAVWQLAENELTLLDRKEGTGWAYRLSPVKVRLDDSGGDLDAVTYRVV